MTFSVWVAIALSVAMVLVSGFTWFYHDSKHRDLDSWVDYGFSRDTLRHALLYYRFMWLSIIVFYALFTVSCLMLQADGIKIFADDKGPTLAGPITTAVFAFDLVLRGETHQVIFDHGKGGFTAQPIWKLLDGEITPELMYRPTFKFLKV